MDTTITPKITTMRELLEMLSDDTWQKPPQGIDPVVRSVAKSKEWIETTGQTSGHRWHITPEGFVELERLRSGEPVANESVFRVLDGGINLDDPNLLDDRTPDTQQKDIVEGHLTKIRNLEITIDDMNALIDHRDSQIESLRRCIGEMEVKMVQLEKQANHTEGMLAIQILDELCDLIPEVEAYRMARESAVKAISGLKARR